MRALLRRLLFAGACVCVALGAGLWAFEASGGLLRVVRSVLERELGPLAERVAIERAALRWFEPGLVLEGVRVTRGAGAPELALERVHLSFTLAFRPGALRVAGGELHVGDRLLADWDELVAHRRTLPEPEEPTELPPCALSGLRLFLELPDATAFELGALDLLARARAGAATPSVELAGRFTPVLGGAVGAPAAILVGGEVDRTGARLSASAREVPLRSEGAELAALGPLPVAELSARLTLDASVVTGPERAPRAELRARVDQGRVLQRAGGHAWEELELELEAAFEPRPGMAFWERDAWDARARLAGDELSAWAEFGRAVPDGRWARAWISARGLRADPASLDELGVETRFAAARQLLDPSGAIDVNAAATLDWDAALGWRRELALHVGARGALGLTYQGVPGEPRTGLPLPVTGVRGDLVLAERPAGTPAWRAAAVGLTGQHASGSASGWARFRALEHPVPHLPFEYEVVISTPAVRVDEALQKALAANRHLDWLWPAFSPAGGTVSADWRLLAAPELGGFSAAGRFGFHGLALRWSEVPVPLESVEGEVELRWAPHPTRVTDGPWPEHRPFGVLYRMGNVREPRVGAQAAAVGWLREDALPDPVAFAAIPVELVQDMALDIEGLGLRGRDFDVLAARFPALGRQVQELGARGLMRVHYQGARATPTAPYLSTIEATPLEVEVTPRFFQRRTNVQGRILVETVEDEHGGSTNASQLSLAGQWPGGVELATRGVIPPAGEARVTVFGAGLDPTNTAFKGALVTTLSEGSPASAGIDLSAWKLAGPVDFVVEALFDPNSDAPARNETRVYLRDNDLESEDVRLEHLHGTFYQRDEMFESPLVYGTLGGHPIEMRSVRTFPLGALARVEGADPWLAREGYWKDPEGRALQADLFVRDLPLDAEHLAGLLAPDAVERLRANEHWRGALDVLGAHLLVTSEGDDQDKVAVRGRVRPHDLALRLGLPLAIDTADVELEELVLESGRLRGWARISGLDARVAERELRGASMIAGYVDGRLTVDNLTGEFEGGRLESLGGATGGARKALGVDLSEPYRFDVAVRARALGVAGLLRGVFQSSIADEGRLDATLQLSGTPDAILDLSGRGTLSLDEGSLWSIPVMRELFLQLGFDRAGLFDRMRARFELRDGRIHTSHLEIRSSLLDLVGAGWQDLDGRLAYDLEVRYGLLDKLGPLSRVLYWLNNSLWRVAVRGDFARPKVTIRNSILEILKHFDKNPERELPLPPFSALGPRF